MHFVVVGHLTRDVVPGGYTLGGTASYAALTAKRLGADVTVVTRAHPADAQTLALAGIEVINLPSDITTTFQNIYRGHTRIQYLRAVAAPIFASEWPQHLNQADVVLLGPLVQEVDPAIAANIQGYLGSTPQGWMREWDNTGRVYPVPWYCAGRITPYAEALILSEADLAPEDRSLPWIIDQVPIVVLTESYEGCVINVNGEHVRIPPRPANEVDPTGAGDVFAAAFLVRLNQGYSPCQAAYFANVTASFSTEGSGFASIPHFDQVEAYINEHPFTHP